MTPEIIYTAGADDDLRLVEIDVENYPAVLRLKVAEGQQRFVASNAVSLAQGHYHPEAWFRAVYLNGEAVGFVMLYDPRRASAGRQADGSRSDLGDMVAGDGLFIWRLMIGAQHQGRGIGRRLITLLAELTRANGFDRLYLSYEEGEGGPGPFYAGCGFVTTGRLIEGEVEARLDLA